MDEKKVVVGIALGQVCPKREDQQFPTPIVEEAILALEALWEGDRLEASKHAGAFGFLLAQRVIR